MHNLFTAWPFYWSLLIANIIDQGNFEVVRWKTDVTGCMMTQQTRMSFILKIPENWPFGGETGLPGLGEQLTELHFTLGKRDY